jgi:ribonuclease HI
MPYYAVSNGYHQGIYLTWSECQKEINGFPNAIYKKFTTKLEAKSFLISSTTVEVIKKTSNISTSIPVKIQTDAILIFTDGACKNQGAKSKSLWKAGYGYYIPSLNRKCHGPISPPLTNNRAELTAIILAISEFPKGTNIHIVTDSKYSYLIFTGTGSRYQSKDYKEKGKDVLNRDLVQQAVELANNYILNFTHVFAHTGLNDELSLGNQIADKLAVKGANGESSN